MTQNRNELTPEEIKAGVADVFRTVMRKKPMKVLIMYVGEDKQPGTAYAACSTADLLVFREYLSDHIQKEMGFK